PGPSLFPYTALFRSYSAAMLSYASRAVMVRLVGWPAGTLGAVPWIATISALAAPAPTVRLAVSENAPSTPVTVCVPATVAVQVRSEEHTSELQSLAY